MINLSRSVKSFLFLILLISFITQPVLGNTQNITEVNVDHQLSYDIFMDNETGTYSANVASFITIYPTDVIHIEYVEVKITTFTYNDSFNYKYEVHENYQIHNNFSKYSTTEKNKYFTVHEQTYEVKHYRKSTIDNNQVRLLLSEFKIKNVSHALIPELLISVIIPHQTYTIGLNPNIHNINNTKLNLNPTRVMIGLPYDDYNSSGLVYSSMPEEDVHMEGKQNTVILNGIEEYTEHSRSFPLFFSVKEDKSKKRLDKITMNSEALWIFGIEIAFFIAFIFTYTFPIILKNRFVVNKLSLSEKIHFIPFIVLFIDIIRRYLFYIKL